MAKSLRSKWKRKMRAIKREKMDVKVLARLKNMLAASEVEQKLDAQEAKIKEKKIQKKKEGTSKEEAEVEMAEPTEESTTEPTTSDNEGSSSITMEVETVAPKKTKANFKTLRNEKNQYPIWMTTKKIHKYAKLGKKMKKRRGKEAKKARIWKMACAAV